MRLSASACLLLLPVSACASGLKYSIDDNAIANVSLEDRKDVLAAQGALNQARAEQQKADADLGQVQGQREMAVKEAKQATLEAEKSLDAQKLAEQSHDIKQMNSANRGKEVAAAAEK